MRESLRATGYLAVGAGTALLALVTLPLGPYGRRVAAVERSRAGRRLGTTIEAGESPRVLLWHLGHGLSGLVLGYLALGLWPVLLLALGLPLWWRLLPGGVLLSFGPVATGVPSALLLGLVQAALVLALLVVALPRLATGQARLAEVLLRPTARERGERAVLAHGDEVHRIERDLHDGTQAQLVAISLRLGLAERAFSANPAGALDLVREAHDGVEQALVDLRHLVHGVHPPVLTERGLVGAVRGLAARCGVPTSVRAGRDLDRLAPAVEAALYFVVAEALTNVTRHGEASEVCVRIGRSRRSVWVSVRDDGRGGAAERVGGGLAGIRRRVAALAGRTRLTSPPGGPTELRVVLPCGS
ncbi:signal transduction histidine kinase [Kutzneria viridogrisea]|uniref:histidine kinase n=1 Tax=Kutzneria viridogrisea TaxID=47990 RepID=A0ABR6BHH9_9PSEU|nr:signal transduction histidine kinase [Kutzneria viridogrisea]